MRPVRVVPDLLRRSAHLVPGRPAVVLAGGPALTFAELDRRSELVAHGLAARGVRRGDRVALLHSGADWPDYMVAYFGTLKAGAVALLIGDRFTDDGLRSLVAGYDVVGALRASTGTSHATTDLACWTAATTAIEADGRPGPFPTETAPDAESDAEVIFTSGTTAEPRGVVATHANLIHARTAWPSAVSANQPCAHALPLGSVAAQVVLLNCVGLQHTLLVLPEFSVAGLLDLVEEGRATTVCLVPAMGHWLVRAAPDGVRPLPTVRGVSFSGAALPTAIMADLPRIFPRAAFHNFYTSTEAYPARVATRFDPDRPESVGRPVGTSAVRVTGTDGAELNPGEVGEVWLRAAGAPPRHLLDPRRAPVAAGTVRDGWTRTGDLGYLDADGALFLAGRTTDIAIVGGFNVSLGRVEQVLLRHAAVAEAAVFAVDHAVLGEIVAALVVLHGDATVRDLRRHAAGELSRRELPAVIRIVDEIPSSPAGKVVKRNLPALLDAPGAAGFVPARTATERALADVWARVLDLGAVGVTDDFFEIGGDSLAATRIAAEVGERLGVPLDAVAVFEASTVAELAETIERNP